MIHYLLPVCALKGVLIIYCVLCFARMLVGQCTDVVEIISLSSYQYMDGGRIVETPGTIKVKALHVGTVYTKCFKELFMKYELENCSNRVVHYYYWLVPSVSGALLLLVGAKFEHCKTLKPENVLSCP